MDARWMVDGWFCGWYMDGFSGWYMDARLMLFSGWYMDGTLTVFSGWFFWMVHGW